MRSGGTEGALSAAELDAILAAPETAKEDVGQRLAIMQRLLGLRCTESLVGDAMQALDDDLNKLVGDEIIAFNATSELYGSARMLLSRVEDEELREAVIGGFKCDMTEVLKPASDVRPSKGGYRLERGGDRVAQDVLLGGPGAPVRRRLESVSTKKLLLIAQPSLQHERHVEVPGPRVADHGADRLIE